MKHDSGNSGNSSKWDMPKHSLLHQHEKALYQVQANQQELAAHPHASASVEYVHMTVGISESVTYPATFQPMAFQQMALQEESEKAPRHPPPAVVHQWHNASRLLEDF